MRSTHLNYFNKRKEQSNTRTRTEIIQSELWKNFMKPYKEDWAANFELISNEIRINRETDSAITNQNIEIKITHHANIMIYERH